MKAKLLSFLLLIPVLAHLFGQGSGIGYQLEIGGSNFSHSAPYYDQSIRTTIHNGFMRFHSKDGANATQLMIGYRTDTVHFDNYSHYMTVDGEIRNYSTRAMLERNAWRAGLINQMQWGRPGRFVFALNTGAFYEHTVKGQRMSHLDEINYYLHNELRTHNIGFLLGAEFRLGWFTIGGKYEKLVWDVIDHDYVSSRHPMPGNSSELRGIKMNPGMAYIFFALNLDFFSKD